MFIHIGNDHVIETNDVVAIIDKNLESSSTIMQEMLAKAKEQNTLLGSKSMAKSIVVTTDKIYYSTLSVATLEKRAGMETMINKLDDYSDELDVEESDLL
ncbi:MAG TPA: DUF370 domain-containing protein [Bacillota bacterium]|nr:DUF370 domain-containing protein [Bacillota bacterium]